MHWQNGGLTELVHQHQEIIFSSSRRNADELINNNLSLNKKLADVSADGTRNIATSPMQQR